MHLAAKDGLSRPRSRSKHSRRSRASHPCLAARVAFRDARTAGVSWSRATRSLHVRPGGPLHCRPGSTPATPTGPLLRVRDLLFHRSLQLRLERTCKTSVHENDSFAAPSRRGAHDNQSQQGAAHVRIETVEHTTQRAQPVLARAGGLTHLCWRSIRSSSPFGVFLRTSDRTSATRAALVRYSFGKRLSAFEPSSPPPLMFFGM